MNPNEALRIAEIAVGSTAGLAGMYFGGRAILNSLRSRRNNSHYDRNDLSRKPTTSFPIARRGRDQRPISLIPFFNRGRQSSRTRHGNRSRG